MLEIIALILTGKNINRLALRKGLRPELWVIFNIISWFAVEFIGIVLGIVVLQSRDIYALAMLGLVSGFGCYLLIRYILQKKPDPTPNEDVNRVSVDDLQP